MDTIDQHHQKAKKNFPQEKDTAGKFYDIYVSNFSELNIIMGKIQYIMREREREKNQSLIGKCAVWLI